MVTAIVSTTFLVMRRVMGDLRRRIRGWLVAIRVGSLLYVAKDELETTDRSRARGATDSNGAPLYESATDSTATTTNRALAKTDGDGNPVAAPVYVKSGTSSFETTVVFAEAKKDGDSLVYAAGTTTRSSDAKRDSSSRRLYSAAYTTDGSLGYSVSRRVSHDENGIHSMVVINGGQVGDVIDVDGVSDGELDGVSTIVGGDASSESDDLAALYDFDDDTESESFGQNSRIVLLNGAFKGDVDARGGDDLIFLVGSSDANDAARSGVWRRDDGSLAHSNDEGTLRRGGDVRGGSGSDLIV